MAVPGNPFSNAYASKVGNVGKMPNVGKAGIPATKSPVAGPSSQKQKVAIAINAAKKGKGQLTR